MTDVKLNVDKKATTADISLIPKQGGVLNKGSLASYVQSFSREAIDELVNVMRNSRQESLRMGAARILLDKALPDLKATEISGAEENPLLIRIVSDKAQIESME